jgi:hypothetical protein
MQYKELAERLADLGRPIPVLGLRRLERGERRADADDLTALALALETTPNRLMLPGIDLPTASTAMALTPEVSGTPQQLWEWAQGEQPLRTPLEPAWDRSDAERRYWFTVGSKPYLADALVIAGGGVPGRDADRSPDLQDKLGDVMTAARAGLALGLAPAEVRCAVELAITASLLGTG